MSTVKQVCLGVAAAGVIAGAGTVLATGVAYADTTTDSGSSASASADSPGGESSSERSATRTEKKENEEKNDDDDTSASDDVSKSSTTSPEPDDDSDDTPSRTFGSTNTSDDDQGADDDSDASTSEDLTNEDTAAIEDTAAEPVQPAVLTREEIKAAQAPQRKQRDLPLPLLPTTPAAPAVTTTAAAERNRAATTADVTATAVDPTKQRVLVIGVDGTNLSRVLDNPANTNFWELMQTGTTGAASIVGHTTISNPSWTAILTGVWDNKSGVINNVFTPSTYNRWPTVFNQLEEYNPNIKTKAIADWKVVADIAGAGSTPADEVIYIPQGPNDPVYAAADAAVTAETVKSILGTDPGYENVPNFMFTYMTGVDEAGHLYGGASTQYAQAIERANVNVGLILDAVAAREAATCAAGPSTCEDWTIIMVTDHGHQPQQGFGHGFQSPDETSTFVIVDGPDFDDAKMNLKYSIVDVTPTVVSLFGLGPRGDADGVPLTDLTGSQVDPVNLRQALQDAIDMYGWPDIQTNVALSLRTVFATIPYYVDTFTADITSQLQAIAGQGIFLVSDVAAIAVFPVELIGDALYAVTNAIAQVVARLTGIDGAGPLLPSSADRDGQPYPWIVV
ncbi:hypothetical protein BVC93_01525 [Mycobacterium sp. MS1601]|uniref:alkaline phosphatase family protein n=1 Tax=Mycobacterium sp. MS1601 TaxID=1936029 RepID=UPI0009796E81|nr:alkaline phosphatase family protein [Mycobacterium sp. MS1601]AQA01325.1 hypothetical protein BVC93_01525 [Mycobacterium sp. MS1601]